MNEPLTWEDSAREKPDEFLLRHLGIWLSRSFIEQLANEYSLDNPTDLVEIPRIVQQSPEGRIPSEL